MRKILLLSVVAIVVLSGLCYGMEYGVSVVSPTDMAVLASGNGHVSTAYSGELSFSPKGIPSLANSDVRNTRSSAATTESCSVSLSFSPKC